MVLVSIMPAIIMHVSMMHVSMMHISMSHSEFSYKELDVKAVLFSYFRNLKSTVSNEKTENDFCEVTLAVEDGSFC